MTNIVMVLGCAQVGTCRFAQLLKKSSGTVVQARVDGIVTLQYYRRIERQLIVLFICVFKSKEMIALPEIPVSTLSGFVPFQ